MNLIFILNSIIFGVGLAMDAFSVSIANGLAEPDMKKNKLLITSAVFGIFQTVMPLVGWMLVRFVLDTFVLIKKYIPWVALVLLILLGAKMIIGNLKGGKITAATGVGALLFQGFATSVDALSVGLFTAEMPLLNAIVAALIIGGVTFGLCTLGVFMGRKMGVHMAGRAGVVGGIILILIAVEILLI